MGGEIGSLVDGGYQKFFRTPSGKTKPALASELKALHDFEEDLKEGLGQESSTTSRWARFPPIIFTIGLRIATAACPSASGNNKDYIPGLGVSARCRLRTAGGTVPVCFRTCSKYCCT